MRPFVRLLALLLSSAAVGGCSTERKETTARPAGPLSAGAVARIGDVELPAPLVAQVAAARHVPLRDATSLLVEDALLAQGARQAKLDAEPHQAAKIKAVHARRAIEQLLEAQPAAAPASDADVQEMTNELWYMVDRGEALRVTHAIVLSAKSGSSRDLPDTPELNARRLALAERVRDAVHDAKDAKEFQALAQAIPPDGLELKVETLAPLVRDGRAFDGTSFDTDFAAGAFDVPPGSHVSGVVPSQFGWHVIFVTERLPAVHATLEERRALATRLQGEKRTKDAYDAHAAELRKRLHVEISTAAETDMTSVLPSSPR